MKQTVCINIMLERCSDGLIKFSEWLEKMPNNSKVLHSVGTEPCRVLRNYLSIFGMSERKKFYRALNFLVSFLFQDKKERIDLKLR